MPHCEPSSLGESNMFEADPKSELQQEATNGRRRMAIRVVLPDEPPCLYVVRPGISLASLVREAVRGRPWFAIADVLSASCDFGPSWRTRELGSCELDNLTSIFVRAHAPPTVRIAIVGPHRAGPTQEVTLRLGHTDWSWLRVMEAAQRSPEASFGRAVASQWGLYYQRSGRRRRSICGVKGGRVVELDMEDGRPASWANSTHLVCDFLAPNSGVRWTEGLTPIVVAWPSCDLFGVGQNGQLREMRWEDDALFHPKWVLFLRARRCWSEKLASWSTYMQLRDGSYCCLVTGCEFSDENEMVAKSALGRKKWRRILILLESGSLLPKCALSAKDVSVFRRDGCDLAVDDGRVKALGGPQVLEGSSTWTSTFMWMKDDLAASVSQSMRKRQLRDEGF